MSHFLYYSSKANIAQAVFRPDDLWPMPYVIRMTYDETLIHPNDITKFE